MARKRIPRGRIPKAPVQTVEALDGQTCLKCNRPATVWQLGYYCATHQPSEALATNCEHTSTVTRHGREVCSYCGGLLKETP